MLGRNRDYCFILFLHVQIKYIFKISQNQKVTDGAKEPVCTKPRLLGQISHLQAVYTGNCREYVCQQEPCCVCEETWGRGRTAPTGLHPQPTGKQMTLELSEPRSLQFLSYFYWPYFSHKLPKGTLGKGFIIMWCSCGKWESRFKHIFSSVSSFWPSTHCQLTLFLRIHGF